jgi:putative DNA primase/helicase
MARRSGCRGRTTPAGPAAPRSERGQLNAIYDPKARCPAIERFVRQVLPDERDVELFFELIGYLMVPDNTQQKAVMLLGPGGNGKSTALNLATTFLGGRTNVSNVPLQKIDDNRFASSDLYGVLANVCADLDATAMTSTSEFKKIVGGDPIHAERKHRDAFTFTPYARLVFSTNEPPPSSDVSQAFFDRWIILPFEQRFRGTEAEDKNLILKLTTPSELSGLLNLALTGLGRLRENGGFTTSAATQEAGKQFRISVDSAAAYIHEAVEIGPDYRTKMADLFSSYCAWCATNNRRALGAQRFHRRVREIVDPSPLLWPDGLDEVVVNGSPTYLGINRKTWP